VRSRKALEISDGATRDRTAQSVSATGWRPTRSWRGIRWRDVVAFSVLAYLLAWVAWAPASFLGWARSADASAESMGAQTLP
jgi:hypothetical protein